MSFQSSGPLRPWALSRLQSNLRLMGFPDLPSSNLVSKDSKAKIKSSSSAAERERCEAMLNNTELFEHSDAAAFQQIIYFLLHQFDPMLAASTFRDVWPVIEKKQEAEFRKKVFAAYKDIQTTHKDELSTVNAALFLSPGGKKFVNFLYELSHFVLVSKVREMKASAGEAPLRQFHSRDGRVSTQKRLLDKLTRRNLVAAGKAREESAQLVSRSKGFADKNADKLRSAKLLSQQLDAEHARRLEEEGVESVDALEAKCEDIKRKHDQLLEQCREPVRVCLESLDKIDEVVLAEKNNNVLDVSHLVPEGCGEGLPLVLERLLRVVEEPNLVERMTSLPVATAEEKSVTVKRHLEVMEEKAAEVEREALPAIAAHIRDLEDGQGFAEIEVDQSLLPKPLPPVQIDLRKKSDGEPGKFSLLYHLAKKVGEKAEEEEEGGGVTAAAEETMRRHQQQHDVSKIFMPSFTAYSYENREPHPKRHHRQEQYSPPSAKAMMSSTSSSSAAAAAMMTVDESKLSVFSPILSSSRMDATVTNYNNVNNDSPVLNLSCASNGSSGGMKKKKPKVDLSTQFANRDKRLESPLSEERVTSPLFARPMLSKKANLAPIRLSPSFLKSPEEDKEEDSGKKISSRLNDLMSSLANSTLDEMDESSLQDLNI